MNNLLEQWVKEYRELKKEYIKLQHEGDDEALYQNEVISERLYRKIVKERGLYPTNRDKIKIGYYRHFKGKWYCVLGIAKDCDNIEHEVVVYQALYGNKELYYRDLKEFESYIDFDKYPDYDADTYRFTSFDELMAKIGASATITLMQDEIKHFKE